MLLTSRRFRDFDWFLTAVAVSIAAFGVWQIYNAQPEQTYWQKQIIGIVIALAAMFAVAFSDYRRLVHFAPVFYAAGLVLLLLVLVPGIGHKVNGQQAWILIPGIGTFQPSEFVKIPTALMLARYFGRPHPRPLAWREIGVGLGILALPVGLILMEPDTGQAMTYFPLLAVVIFLSSIRMWIVVASLAAMLIGVPGAYIVAVKVGIVKNYQQERINAIIDPESADPRGYAYHTIQSMITVGKGKMTGSENDSDFSQSRLKYLPEPQTDFIYAVTAENTGFVGSALLLLAYAVLLSKLILDARSSPDRTGMLVIMAFVGGFLFSICVNVGMVLGMLPVIGVPLPLMSAGLSAVLSTFIAIGFAVSVQLRRFVN